MGLQPIHSRSVAVHAPPRAFVEHCEYTLSRLGYDLWRPDGSDVDDERRPDLRIVEERQLAEVCEEPGEDPLPIIVLTGRHGVTGADPRIVGAVARPAGLHDLYRLLQQFFEEKPRSTPRVATHIRAACQRHGRRWSGSVLSLSENGCLLRSSEVLPLGARVDLRFDLPSEGTIELRAETAYQLVPDLGLVFSAIPSQTRDAIASYVTRVLTSG